MTTKDDRDQPIPSHGGVRHGAGRPLGSRNYSADRARYAAARADRAEFLVEVRRLEAEARLLSLQERAGGLIPAKESHRVLSQVIRAMVNWAETLPDILEREAGLQQDQVETVQRCVDRLRELLPAVPGATG